MISARLVLAAVIGGQAVIVSAGLAAEPQGNPVSAPPVPQSKATAHGPAPATPLGAGPAAQDPGIADAWTPEEIAEAQAHCTAKLKGLGAVVNPLEPIKKGACGAPAPVTLVSLGSNPEVVLSPPATVTCDMVAALDAWLRGDVQPLAKKLLGAPVVEIQTMSSYSCRNAYGRARTKLSEHGRANALDIGGFLTADARSAKVLGGWGPTERETKALAASEAARQKATEKAAAEQVGAGEPPSRQPAGPHREAEPGADWTLTIATQIKGMLGLTGAVAEDDAETALGLAAPSRLGGPRPADEATPAPAPNPDRGARTQFLRQVHAAACKHFGTVLGPEANEAHKNHFHLDMAERQRANFCE